MRNLILTLLAFLAVFTFFRAFENVEAEALPKETYIEAPIEVSMEASIEALMEIHMEIAH